MPDPNDAAVLRQWKEQVDANADYAFDLAKTQLYWAACNALATYPSVSVVGGTTPEEVRFDRKVYAEMARRAWQHLTTLKRTSASRRLRYIADGCEHASRTPARGGCGCG